MTRHILASACLVLLCLPLFFQRLADRDLWASHEARAAQNAQSLLTDGNWGLPHLFDGKPELQKPPLYYWLVASLAWLRGAAVDAWAVRLPAALAGLGGVLLVWFVLQRAGRPWAAFLAAGMLATALHYTWLARTGRIDMPLTLAVSAALCGYYLACVPQAGEPDAPSKGEHAQTLALAWRVGLAGRSQSSTCLWFLPLLLAYLALAAGVLLKGPIALVLPVAVIALHLLLEGRLPAPWRGKSLLRLAHKLGLWWGLPLVLALTAPWFVWVDRETGGEFSRTFFWKHNLQRGLGGASDLAAHPWWFYLPRLSFDLLPWSPLFVLFAGLMFRRGWWRVDPEARFGLVWCAAIVGVLSLASFKRADYLLPAYPGAALFLGCAAERWLREPARHVFFRRAFFPVAFCLIPAGWWYYLDQVLPAQDAELECRRFAAAIRQQAPDRLVLFFRAENHALAFHVGRPVATLLEWENLDIWAALPETIHVVMPAEVAREWPQHLRAGRLEHVLRSTDLTGGTHHRPLVLLRTVVGRTADAGTAAPAADCRRAAERPADGGQRAATPGRPPGPVDATTRQAGAGL